MIGRRVSTLGDIERPGDYCGPIKGYTGELESCFFIKPNGERSGGIHHANFPPHRYRECDDGSLEIRESISDKTAGSDISDGWHGYLDEGHVWRQV